jgi:hypothetical protein
LAGNGAAVAPRLPDRFIDHGDQANCSELGLDKDGIVARANGHEPTHNN